MRSFKYCARYCFACFYLNPWIASFVIFFFCAAFVTVYFVLGIAGSFSLITPKHDSLLSFEPYKLINTYNEPLLEPKNLPEQQQFKKILFWNEAYGGKSYDIGVGRDVFRRAGCSVWQCESTDDRKVFKPEELDAIVFHQRSWYTIEIQKLYSTFKIFKILFLIQ
jgi:hypothetical protein